MPTNDQDHANSIREVILQSPSTYEIWFRKPFCYSALTCSPNSLCSSSSDKTSNIDISLSMKRWIHSEYNLEGLSNLHPVGEVKHSLVQNMTFTFMTQKNSLKETTNRTTNIMIKKKNSESNRIMPRFSDLKICMAMHIAYLCDHLSWESIHVHYGYGSQCRQLRSIWR
jgi:hypothetical protein